MSTLIAVCEFTYTDPVSGETQVINPQQQISDPVMIANILASYVLVPDPNNSGSTLQLDNPMRTCVVVSS